MEYWSSPRIWNDRVRKNIFNLKVFLSTFSMFLPSSFFLFLFLCFLIEAFLRWVVNLSKLQVWPWELIGSSEYIIGTHWLWVHCRVTRLCHLLGRSDTCFSFLFLFWKEKSLLISCLVYESCSSRSWLKDVCLCLCLCLFT